MQEPARLRSPAAGESSRWPLVLFTFFGIACLVVPAAFWWATTFTKRLDDAELTARLAPEATPREVLHATEELSKRFDEGRPGMDRWAEKLVEASRRSEEPVRVACAWAMQYDAGRPGFVERLREMVGDDRSPLVRRNAATALALAGDAAARPVLLRMLEPHEVVAPGGGRVGSLLGVGQTVEVRMVVARLGDEGDGELEVAAALPGRVVEQVVAEGALIEPGASLLRVAPSAEHALHAVGGLAFVGTREDIPLLRRVADPRSGFGAEVQRAAPAAIRAIEERTEE